MSATGQTRTTTYREALRESLRDALRADERVFLMGEDVDAHGGASGVSRDLLDELEPGRVRDAPPSEAAFVGAGIGAALGGLRPIVEVTTVDASLLAISQIVNDAAAIPHTSGGRLAIPLVLRMTTGAGYRPAAGRSHSLGHWYAHVPGLIVLTPATLEDARGMLAPALADPNPVLIMEHGSLYDLEGELADPPPQVPLTGAAVRRAGGDVTLIAYGGSLPKTLEAATVLAQEGIEAEVLDLRSLRPLDDEAILASVARTHRVVVVDEAWRTGSFAAEVVARIAERALHELAAPPERVCSVEVPIPWAKHLEDAALPSVAAIAAAVRGVLAHP